MRNAKLAKKSKVFTTEASGVCQEPCEREVPDRGAKRCPRCNYFLEGLPDSSEVIVCPECGKRTPVDAIESAAGWRRRSIVRIAALVIAYACFVGSCWLVLESESGTGDGQAGFAYIGFAAIGLPLLALATICSANELWMLVWVRAEPTRSARGMGWVVTTATLLTAAALGTLAIASW